MLPDDYVAPISLESKKKTGIGVNGNLIPAKPGEVRNPVGRIPGSKNRATIARKMAAVITGGVDVKGDIAPNMTAEELMNATLWRKAFDGDINAIKELQDTLYGKLTDKQELSGPDGGAIPITSLPPQEAYAKLRDA